MDGTTQKNARVSGYGHTPQGSKVEFSNLTELEVERLQGTLLGQWWARGNNGRLEFAPAREPAPAPTEDDMLPGWHAPREGEGTEQYQRELFDAQRFGGEYASIQIQHLCGHHYTANGYKRNAEFLESCGFICMRSRRGDDGKFWEVWYLSGLWSAKGRLKEALRGIPKEFQINSALEFLAKNASFGTLDVASQRIAQVID